MENITLGQIAAGIGIILVIAGGYKKLYDAIKDNLEKIVSKIVADLLQPISDSILEINQRLSVVDMESTKNFLVRCIADMERGEEMSETENERFWEQYDYYIKAGGNTYIKNKVEKLKKEGRL
jgi:rRNA pseudouridine-1189 N-methylase Emg1 (Nep1/Mra1 family)